MSRPPIADADRLIALYEEGYALRDIARQTGRTYQAVSAWLIAHGHHHPTPRRVPSIAVRQQSVDWYARGYPIAAICARFGIAQTTLYDYVRQDGVPLRNPKLSAALSRPRRREEPTP